MERYNYREAVLEDVLEYIRDNYTPEEIRESLRDLENRDEWQTDLYDLLFISDSVTGNASGSYYCNAWKAEEALCHNLELLGEALEEFCCGPEYIKKKGAEACDVIIRCYLLGAAIQEALEILEEEAEEDGER